MFEVLVGAIRQLKAIKVMLFEKGEVKLLLIADDMILYISDPQNYTRELLQLTNTFGKTDGYIRFMHKKIRSPSIYKTQTS